MYEIKTEDFYKDIKGDIDRWFDTSAYPKDHAIGKWVNKKVIGMMKDETAAAGEITEFVGLRSKLYAYKIDEKEEKKCKGYFDRSLHFHETVVCELSSSPELSELVPPSNSEEDKDSESSISMQGSPEHIGEVALLTTTHPFVRPGKGSPGMPRKDKVCQRQKRRRLQKNIQVKRRLNTDDSEQSLQIPLNELKKIPSHWHHDVPLRRECISGLNTTTLLKFSKPFESTDALKGDESMYTQRTLKKIPSHWHHDVPLRRECISGLNTTTLLKFSKPFESTDALKGDESMYTQRTLKKIPSHWHHDVPLRRECISGLNTTTLLKFSKPFESTDALKGDESMYTQRTLKKIPSHWHHDVPLRRECISGLNTTTLLKFSKPFESTDALKGDESMYTQRTLKKIPSHWHHDVPLRRECISGLNTTTLLKFSKPFESTDALKGDESMYTQRTLKKIPSHWHHDVPLRRECISGLNTTTLLKFSKPFESTDALKGDESMYTQRTLKKIPSHWHHDVPLRRECISGLNTTTLLKFSKPFESTDALKGDESMYTQRTLKKIPSHWHHDVPLRRECISGLNTTTLLKFSKPFESTDALKGDESMYTQRTLKKIPSHWHHDVPLRRECISGLNTTTLLKFSKPFESTDALKGDESMYTQRTLKKIPSHWHHDVPLRRECISGLNTTTLLKFSKPFESTDALKGDESMYTQRTLKKIPSHWHHDVPLRRECISGLNTTTLLKFSKPFESTDALKGDESMYTQRTLKKIPSHWHHDVPLRRECISGLNTTTLLKFSKPFESTDALKGDESMYTQRTLKKIPSHWHHDVPLRRECISGLNTTTLLKFSKPFESTDALKGDESMYTQRTLKKIPSHWHHDVPLRRECISGLNTTTLLKFSKPFESTDALKGDESMYTQRTLKKIPSHWHHDVPLRRECISGLNTTTLLKFSKPFESTDALKGDESMYTQRTLKKIPSHWHHDVPLRRECISGLNTTTLLKFSKPFESTDALKGDESMYTQRTLKKIPSHWHHDVPLRRECISGLNTTTLLKFSKPFESTDALKGDESMYTQRTLKKIPSHWHHDVPLRRECISGLNTTTLLKFSKPFESTDALKGDESMYTQRTFHQDGEPSDDQDISDKGNRPMHCDATDSAATCVKHHHIGFSESSLTRDRQFCCSTPFGSPPSMACLRPSDLQSCVVKYLQQVLNRIGDDQADYLPETFRSEELSKPPSPECLWKLNKNTIHLFDGDGGEESMVPFAVKLAEEGHTYQYLKYGYSPQVATAVKTAVARKAGFRSLPRRVWSYPFRPYDVRKEWKDNSEVYAKDYEIPTQDMDSCELLNQTAPAPAMVNPTKIR
ncbi:hypothetical protein QZH41_001450 [Actinostola sp. cb2023]|nr:hypothetical protein QZH41_001450 [Actinostola sp. cb2023]